MTDSGSGLRTRNQRRTPPPHKRGSLGTRGAATVSIEMVETLFQEIATHVIIKRTNLTVRSVFFTLDEPESVKKRVWRALDSEWFLLQRFALVLESGLRITMHACETARPVIVDTPTWLSTYFLRQELKLSLETSRTGLDLTAIVNRAQDTDLKTAELTEDYDNVIPFPRRSVEESERLLNEDLMSLFHNDSKSLTALAATLYPEPYSIVSLRDLLSYDWVKLQSISNTASWNRALLRLQFWLNDHGFDLEESRV